MTNRQSEMAFIGTKAPVLRKSSAVRLCSRTRRRSRSVRHWRCVVQDDPVDKSDDVSQVEGTVSLDQFDAGLEAALSKGWDKLDDFEGLMDRFSKEKEDEDHVIEDSEEDADETNPSENHADSTHAIETTEKDGSQAEDMTQSGKKVKSKPTSKRKRKVTKASEQNADEKSKDEDGLELKESEEWICSDARWYFVQVKPGCEQSTAVSIRNLAASLESSGIREVLVPTTTIMRLSKGGKSVKKEERFFPSYILVLMVMSRRSYSEILAVPNVQFFMNDPNRDKKKNAPLRPPLPVRDAEMKSVFEKIEEANSAKPEIKTTIRPGDYIEVTMGSFVSSTGRVLEVKPDLNVVKANLMVFGEATAVDLELKQVKVIDEPEDDPEAEDAGKGEDGVSTGDNSSGPNVAVASQEDDLAAILQQDEDDSWTDEGRLSPEHDNVHQISEGDDDGFGEADIIENDEEAKPRLHSDEQETRGGNGLISSVDELADMLSDDYRGDNYSQSTVHSTEEEELDGLDAFFSSLDDAGDDDGGDAELLSDEVLLAKVDSKGSQSETGKGKKKKSKGDSKSPSTSREEELARQLITPLKEVEEEDYGFGAHAMMERVDEMMAEIKAGKRKLSPSEEDDDLSQPIVETEEDIPEIDLFAMPDIDAHDDPDSTADPAPMKR